MDLELGARAAQLRSGVMLVWSRVAQQTDEAIRRLREAGRDARHRLKTGRPRGMPTAFVHPPLECSKGCSQAARRVHGLLYGYSLAYAEVRPRVDTIAQALGYSKSTTYNATAELRHAGLLVAHERRGFDHRRIANRYEVRCTPTRAPLASRSEPHKVEKSPAEVQKTRSKTRNAESTNRKSTVDNISREEPADQRRPGLAKARRRRAAPLGEDELAKLIGLERFRVLKLCFTGALDGLLQVITELGAAQHPQLLAASCDALIEQRSTIANPGGYFRGILRRQLGERDSIHTELLELVEEHRQAGMFEDPGADELAARAAALEEKLRRKVGPSPEVKEPASGTAIEVASSAPSSSAPGSQSLDEVVSRLRTSNPRVAEILSRQPEVARQLRAWGT